MEAFSQVCLCVLASHIFYPSILPTCCFTPHHQFACVLPPTQQVSLTRTKVLLQCACTCVSAPRTFYLSVLMQDTHEGYVSHLALFWKARSKRYCIDKQYICFFLPEIIMLCLQMETALINLDPLNTCRYRVSMDNTDWANSIEFQVMNWLKINGKVTDEKGRIKGRASPGCSRCLSHIHIYIYIILYFFFFY